MIDASHQIYNPHKLQVWPLRVPVPNAPCSCSTKMVRTAVCAVHRAKMGWARSNLGEFLYLLNFDYICISITKKAIKYYSVSRTVQNLLYIWINWGASHYLMWPFFEKVYRLKVTLTILYVIYHFKLKYFSLYLTKTNHLFDKFITCWRGCLVPIVLMPMFLWEDIEQNSFRRGLLRELSFYSYLMGRGLNKLWTTCMLMSPMINVSLCPHRWRGGGLQEPTVLLWALLRKKKQVSRRS